MAAPTFVRKTEGAIDDTVLTLNIEVSSGTNRMLVVGLAYRDSSPLTPTSILFNGSESFTVEKAGTDAADAQCFLAYLAAPTETTANVVITMPSGVRMVGYVAYYTGVDQNNPFTANTDDAQGSDAAPTVTITSDTDESCIDVMCQVSAGPDTIDSNSGTLICSGAATGGGSDCRGGGQYEVGAASRQMSYGLSDTDDWNIVAGALQEPQGADLFRTIDDDVGVTDPSQPAEVKTFVRTEDEALGVTDSSQPSRVTTTVRVVVDSLGLTDAQVFVLTFVRVLAESLGVTDAQIKGELKSVSDDVGVTDAETVLKTLVRVVADSLGLTDAMSRTQTVARVVAESLGITDATIQGQSAVRVIAESLGVTDVMTGIPTTDQMWQVNVTKG